MNSGLLRLAEIVIRKALRPERFAGGLLSAGAIAGGIALTGVSAAAAIVSGVMNAKKDSEEEQAEE